MPTRRIDQPKSWQDQLCKHPDHFPKKQGLPPGRYEHKCAGCGLVFQFVIPQPLGRLTDHGYPSVKDFTETWKTDV